MYQSSCLHFYVFVIFICFFFFFSFFFFVFFFFFFSSRRRHTRSYGDWSSDVCSSDLIETIIHNRLNRHHTSVPSLSPFQSAYRKFHSAETALLRIYNDLLVSISQIGRASCRERVYMSDVAVSVKEKIVCHKCNVLDSI